MNRRDGARQKWSGIWPAARKVASAGIWCLALALLAGCGRDPVAPEPIPETVTGCWTVGPWMPLAGGGYGRVRAFVSDCSEPLPHGWTRE